MLSKFPYALLFICLVSVAGALELILSRCCSTGVRWAWENKTCTSYLGPVPNVAVEHQAPCLSTINACCHRNYRERQCILGHNAARSGEQCLEGIGLNSHFHKDCCEGCKLGLIAGAMGLNCEFHSLKLALGPPWDSSLTKCCLQAGGRSPRPGLRDNSRGGESAQNQLIFKPDTRDYCALFAGQLCSQNCVADGASYKCTCDPGFKLLPDGKTCRENDGEAHTTSSENRTTREREFHRKTSGECPTGFIFNAGSQVCDDIDECATREGVASCLPYKTCRNTIGSFLCEQLPREDESSLQCPPGYRYKEESSSCADIDECAEGFDICVREIQYCINTPGGFECQGKREFNRYNCPAGYKFNNKTLNCEDVNECEEKLHSCDQTTEVCRNTAGAYECDVHCSEGYRYEVRVRSCQDIDECSEGQHDCAQEKESCVNVAGSYQCHQVQIADNNCPPGYEPNKNYTFLCQDTDECSSGLHTCASSERCINEVGGYRCERNNEEEVTPNPNEYRGTGIVDNTIPGADSVEDYLDTNEQIDRRSLSTPPQNPQTQSNAIVRDSHPRSCTPGYRRPRSSRPGQTESCEDIDECTENNPCDSSQLCQNTVGSYYCHCRRGYYRDPITRACLDINECQTGQHNCQPSQRCDNSPGSFTCIRITGCGTGYTLNSQTGQCEDDDECLFGNNDCDSLGPEWKCKNTLGSFRCEKTPRTCPTELVLAPNGECKPPCPNGYQFNPRGECVDIDECLQTSTGRSVCPSNKQCVNIQGSFQCFSKIICPAGFEPDPTGSRCTDIDECEKGLHSCKGNQECLNRGGGYVCQCPSGYTVTGEGNCEDIDECSRYNGQVCSSNAECYNLPGSFRCECKDGFEQGTDNRTCTDVDECRSITGLCEQTCVNSWGSYICTCGKGFTLNEDQRTCRDVDECSQVKNGFLCIGNCVNTQGSYRCDCPDGYRLGRDSRTCQDIDECQEGNACRADETCLNIRGGFRCNRVQCPTGYQKEAEHNDRCKKSFECSERDVQCAKRPLTISRNFLSFTSNIRIPNIGYVDMFTMRGPGWTGAVMHFNLELKYARAPHGVAIANADQFLLRRPTNSQAVVSLSKSITGPQDVELELTMEVYHRGQYAGSALAQIVIVVSSYEY